MVQVNLTRRFAERLSEITPDRFTTDDSRQVQRLLLDYCGVAYGGTSRPWIVALHRWARRYHGTGSAKIIASDLAVAPAIAGLVNGAACHSFELDDTHDESMSHPGSVVFSTALAVGAEQSSSGRQIFASVVAGYETMARLGAAADAAGLMEAGYHPTALLGVFGAATTAAKLLKLDADKISCAWGHALSMTSGSVQFSQESSGAEVKRMHAGYAAHNGILAAEFAAAGIEAPRSALDGKYGFLALYSKNPNASQLTEQRPALAIHDISFKFYACCRMMHSMIDGLRTVTDGFTLDPNSIQKVHVLGPACLAQQHMNLQPATSMAAQYSLPYIVGATMTFGPEHFGAYESQNLTNPEIHEWMQRVTVSTDTEFERLSPSHFGTETQITLADGSVRTARVRDSIGARGVPISPEAVQAKAAGLIRAIRPNYSFSLLESEIAGLDRAVDIDTLQAALAYAPTSAQRSQRSP